MANEPYIMTRTDRLERAAAVQCPLSRRAQAGSGFRPAAAVAQRPKEQHITGGDRTLGQHVTGGDRTLGSPLASAQLTVEGRRSLARS